MACPTKRRQEPRLTRTSTTTALATTPRWTPRLRYTSFPAKTGTPADGTARCVSTTPAVGDGLVGFWSFEAPAGGALPVGVDATTGGTAADTDGDGKVNVTVTAFVRDANGWHRYTANDGAMAIR